MSGECSQYLEDPSPTKVAISLVITALTVVSFLPQQILILRLRSSLGLSPFFFLLGGIASTSTLWNVALLQAPVVRCCFVAGWGFQTCVQETLGLIQVAVQWACFQTVFVLFMVFFPPSLRRVRPPHHTDHSRAHDHAHDLTPLKKPTLTAAYRTALLVTLFQTTYLAISIILSLLILSTTGPGSPLATWVAGIAGLVSLMLSSVQFAPQIYQTFTTKLVGSLSIPTMLIQAPGSLAVATLVALTPGTNASSWASYVVAGGMQAVLLGLALWYTWSRPPGGGASDAVLGGGGDEEVDVDVEEDTRPADETAPLIAATER